MKFIERDYENFDDLYAIGRMLRRALPVNPSWNAWAFARFDIWAQRRMADEKILGKTDWKHGFHLWSEPGGALAGAAFFLHSPFAVMLSNPAYPALTKTMLDHLEANASTLKMNEPIRVEVLDSNLHLLEQIKACGYEPSSDSMIIRRKVLHGRQNDAVELPEEYRIISVESEAEIGQYIAAVEAVFHMLDRMDVHAFVRSAPSAVPELSLVALSEKGEPAAVSSVWWDRENNCAEFEPVGTVPGFQQRGLAKALLNYSSNWLRNHGCDVVGVESWSESPAANRLYESAGLLAVDHLHDWGRPKSGQATFTAFL